MTLPITRTTLLLAAGLSAAGTAPAQTAPAAAAPRNVIRLDLLGPHYQNLTYNLLRTNGPFLFPVLLGYERQVGHSRFSGNAELLLNGGNPDTPVRGAALQGRYYLPRVGRPAALQGFYAAPTLSLRQVRPRFSSDPATGTLAGAGVLLGRQWILSKGWCFDLGAGCMKWNIITGNPAPDESDSRYSGTRANQDFEKERFLFDARASIGYAF